jgi:hypothetical protein
VSELITKLELATQKSLTLVSLGFDKEEAFEVPYGLMDEIYETVRKIEDEMARTVAFTTVELAISEFKEKIDAQIK